MRISRLFKIVYLLQEQDRMTAKELSERLEVSSRTIMRDIDTLCEAGIPIYATPGQGGGISIMDHFILNKTLLSREDQNRILFALQSLALSGQIEETELLDKLQAFFNNTRKGWLEVDFSRWGHGGSDKQKFGFIRDAILKHQVLAFSYSSAVGELTERRVNPLRLSFKNNAWYLRGYCLGKDDYRTFKADRMTQVRIMDDTFNPDEFEIPPLEYTVDDFGEIMPMVLEFPRENAYRAYDHFYLEEITRKENGAVVVETNIYEESGIYEFLLSLGGGVKILKPQHAKERLLKLVDEVKALYEL